MTEEVSRIHIKEPGEEFLLVKAENGWVLENLGNFPADGEKVEQLLNKIKEIAAGEVVSSNPEKQAVYAVDEAQGVMVTVSDNVGIELADFVAGKQAMSYQSSYFREADADEVMVIAENLRSVVDLQARDWKDKTILALDTDQIKELKINWEGQEVLLEKAESKWWIGEKEADFEQLSPMLAALKDFQARDFAGAEEFDFEKGVDLVQLHVVLNNDEGIYVKAVKKEAEASEYGVKTSLGELVFKLNSVKIELFKVKAADLEKVEEPVEEMDVDAGETGETLLETAVE